MAERIRNFKAKQCVSSLARKDGDSRGVDNGRPKVHGVLFF